MTSREETQQRAASPEASGAGPAAIVMPRAAGTMPRLPNVASQPLPMLTPVAPAVRLTAPGQEAAAAAERPMFELLVRGDEDVVGLLAYALHEQNRRDWLLAYRPLGQDGPGENELRAYLAGERMPRRLAAYRTLADELLNRRARTPPAATATAPPVSTSSNAAQRPPSYAVEEPRAQRQGSLLGYLFSVGLMLAAIAVVIRLAFGPVLGWTPFPGLRL